MVKPALTLGAAVKRFSILLLVVLLLAGAVFVAAPFFAFRALKAAARVDDVQAIGELVDFPAVRKSLTAQLDNAPVTAEPPSIWQDPLGAMKRALEPLAPPEPKVDRYLTPAGLYALTRGYGPGQGPVVGPPPEKALDRLAEASKEPIPSLLYWGPNRVRFQVHRHEGGLDHVTIFTFERKGPFTWRLVHVGLPKVGAGEAR
ncbi:MAG: hypothetical protein JWP35_2194 [Caulobacter sp.]|nr:hypothetical protein [Caulobacter sp.]